MSWLSVRVRAPGGGAARDAAAAALFAAGTTGVQEEGSETLVTHFPPETDAARVRALVEAASPGAELEFAETPEIDWSERWKARIGAHDLGALSIVPPWLTAGRDPGRTVVIEPGMAFGTGEHPTTRGVVRLLPAVIRRGDRVADLGAGSAVLAIAAAKLGAASVVAIELESDAIPDAEQNVENNGVADRVRVIEGDASILLPLVAPVRVVLANILSSVIIELLPQIREALTPDGEAILSGILQIERDEVLAALQRDAWRVLAEDEEEIWWSVAAAPR